MDSSSNMGNSELEPHDGMEFDSNEAAYDFYKEYAKALGFGTAKLSSRRSRASKEFIDAKFSCIRYGNKQQSDDAINPRPSPKIGCKASLHVKRKPDGKWYVYSFVKEHNHELLPAQVHLFRSHRNADPMKSDVRMRRRKILASVSKQFSAYQNIDCLESFMKNQHDRGRSLSLESGDGQMLLERFMNMQEEDPRFFYAVDLNEEHRLRNIFWVDAKGIEDYAHFGDVVVLDSSYFTYKYKLPLVLFTGVNHYIQPTLLGCALIADETVYTYVWLIQTWLTAMGSQPPQVILTDQNKALEAAIGSLLPDARHFFCLWHVFGKVPKQLEYLSAWLDCFMGKFNKCVYKSSTEEQFEKRWWKLVERFKLQDDECIRSLYDDRRLWVPLFIRGVSLAGLSAASRSESLNSFFDKYVGAETSLREFIERYQLLLEDRLEEEAKAQFDAWHETPDFRSPSPFEKQMAFVYTHVIFKKFQVEVLGAAACHLKKESEDGSSVTFAVKDFEANQDFMVEWNESTSDICCSCHLFEYQGYLCRHAIIVLQMTGVFSIPHKYVLQRWTNAALSRHRISEKLDQVQVMIRRYNDLCRRAIILGEEGSLSQGSYSMALSAIKEALQQCVGLNNSVETNATTDIVHAFNGIEDDNQGSHSTSIDRLPHPQQVNKTNKTPMKIEVGKDKAVAEDNTSARGTITLMQGTTGSQAGFPQLELPNTRSVHLHNMFPVQLHNLMPTMLQNVAPQHLHNMNVHDKHQLPH